ncbi:MAG: hypothetical protein GC152_12600 [Alphaproteobacteria bacterium]|nr:hypothetical protein [Alphaproteobacteria bacterium]
MLLRRMIEHVRAQNWTAVALDFVIVVLGVFIGIQVANWNAARADRQIEAQYLSRLLQELSDMAPKAKAALEEVRERYVLIDDVAHYLATGQGGDALGAKHCGAIRGAHIFAGAIFYPPTIKELISTGRIVLVRDPALRTAILAFDQANLEMSQLRQDIQIDRLLLARKHPALITIDVADWEKVACDYDAMGASHSFLNDFMDNSRRYIAYVDDIHERQFELIKSLGANVAASRGELFNLAADQINEERVNNEQPFTP